MGKFFFWFYWYNRHRALPKFTVHNMVTWLNLLRDDYHNKLASIIHRDRRRKLFFVLVMRICYLLVKNKNTKVGKGVSKSLSANIRSSNLRLQIHTQQEHSNIPSFQAVEISWHEIKNQKLKVGWTVTDTILMYILHSLMPTMKLFFFLPFARF